MSIDLKKKEAQTWLDFLFYPLHSAILIIDVKFQVQYLNQAAEGLFTTSMKASWQQPLTKLFAAEDRIFFHLKEVFTTGLGRTLHDFSLNLRDKFKTVQIEIAPLGIAEDPQAAFILINEFGLPPGIKEEERVRDRIAMLETLALGLAHEIRNPLGGIRGAAQMLSKESDPQERHDYAEIIIKEVDRLNKLLSQLLDFARPKILHRELVNLNQILDEVLRLQRTEIKARYTLEQDLDPSLPPIEGDSDVLKQALLNLIKNACEAMPAGGQLFLQTRFNRDARRISAQGRRAAMAELVIRDSGAGIKKKDLETLFTPFFTTKATGTGLGLVVTQKIIQEHHGFLEIESEFGQGTQVTIYLPFADLRRSSLE